jgi:hypothetical protein
MQKALHDLRQGLLYGFWIVQRYGLTLAGDCFLLDEN